MSELQEQIAALRWASTRALTYKPLLNLFHIPNEGKRSVAGGSLLKQAGLKAGVPDLFLPVPCGKYHGLFIEMKAGNTNARPNQKEWLNRLQENGYSCFVCGSADAAIKVISEYLEIDPGVAISQDVDKMIMKF